MPHQFGRRTVMLTAACIVAVAGARAQETRSTVVETNSGKLRGSTAAGVTSFKGIPYADSTAGLNRFRPPAPVAPWLGFREAGVFGASAPQLPASTDPLTTWYNALEPISEDCLSLNVWTPGT